MWIVDGVELDRIDWIIVVPEVAPTPLGPMGYTEQRLTRRESGRSLAGRRELALCRGLAPRLAACSLLPVGSSLKQKDIADLKLEEHFWKEKNNNK